MGSGNTPATICVAFGAGAAPATILQAEFSARASAMGLVAVLATGSDRTGGGAYCDVQRCYQPTDTHTHTDKLILIKPDHCDY